VISQDVEMTEPLPTSTRELRSTLDASGSLSLMVSEAAVAAPGPDDVVVRIEAAPINPSDLGLLLAGADATDATAIGGDGTPGVQVQVTAGLGAMSARFGKSLPAGNEGGGVVIAAGASAAAQALLGSTVGFASGNAYAEYRTLNVAQCLRMPDGTDPVDAAASFVNPLTALGMVETMRAEGHTALVHTVGASNLGQMLIRICRDDNVALVNIVRKPEHVAMLHELGAEHVVDSSAESFVDDLTAALSATGATIAFDAIGGGELAGLLLARMEKVASQGSEFSRYGSDTAKQVYIYGALDRRPTVLNRNFGLTWSVSGWLLTPFLAKAGPEVSARLRRRVAEEITTTFASSYGMRLALTDAVEPANVRRYAQIATGDKALITPHA
jgi:NADPH2:quinone reductase